MKKARKKQSQYSTQPIGLPPGSLYYTGDIDPIETKITAIVFDKDNKSTILPSNQYIDIAGNKSTWFKIVGLKDIKAINDIAQQFNISSLTVEDVLSTEHQPKFELSETYATIILKLFNKDAVTNSLVSSQLSIIVGKGFLLTFEEYESELIKSFTDRMVSNVNNKNRQVGYITYALVDLIIDHYLAMLDTYQAKIDDMETDLLENNQLNESYDDNLDALFTLRRDTLYIKKHVRSLQEITEKLVHNYVEVFSPDTKPFLKDLLDHAIRVTTLTENMYERINNLFEENFTRLQYRLSKTMNLMTAVSVIFMPLMVITGIYGMNFQNIPELSFKYGYYVTLLVMFIVGLVMFILFKRRKIF